MVQVGRGFVGQYQGGIGGQGAGHRHTLFLAAGELVGALVPLLGHAHRFQQLQHALAAFVGAALAHHQKRVFDVLEGAEHRYQVEVLKHETNVLAAKIGCRTALQFTHVGAGDGQRASAGTVQRPDHVQQGALTRTRRSHEGGKGAGLYVEIHAAHRMHDDITGPVILDQATRLNQRHGMPRNRFDWTAARV